MTQRILVAIDRSSARALVLQQGMQLAQALGANLMLIHVLSAYDDDSPGLPVRAYHSYYPIVDSAAWEMYQQQWEAYENSGLTDLQLLAEEATARGIPTEFTQNTGDPGRVICDMAKTWNADLILMGHRGRKGLSELLLGSVSNYVMHHAPCSVLIVRSVPKPTESEAAEAPAVSVAEG
ncbi:MAG: universal stress protein [Leptolyngbyaceae cyanobacterium T60_A2020_046]|nr:universal stress protein [Leptolyngbyaceae cyanobacterium T60_A2020_046]